MIRLVLLCVGAAFLFVSSAQAHGVHGDCRVGDSWMGVVPHFHPGGYGQAVACGGGGGGGYGRRGYYREPPPPIVGPGYRAPRRGEDAPCPPNTVKMWVAGGGTVCHPH